MAKDFGRDYGIRPALFKNYPDMMSEVSKKAVFDVRVEPDSEFEKPYLTDDYNQQQQIHQLNFAVPYLPAAMLGVTATNPMGALKDCGCNGAVLMVIPRLSSINCGDSVTFSMGGNDGCGKPWNQSKVSWSMGGNVYHAPPCAPGCEHQPDDSFSIIGTNECGASTSVITVKYPEADTGGVLSISGTEDITASSVYTAAGGKTPYTYTVSCGTINPLTGQMSSVTGCCGAGTVSVQDECGQTASMVVRYPTGLWSLVSTCDGRTCCVPCGACYSYTVISGDTKTVSCCCNGVGYDAGCGGCSAHAPYIYSAKKLTYLWGC